MRTKFRGHVHQPAVTTRQYERKSAIMKAISHLKGIFRPDPYARFSIRCCCKPGRSFRRPKRSLPTKSDQLQRRQCLMVERQRLAVFGQHLEHSFHAEFAAIPEPGTVPLLLLSLPMLLRVPRRRF